jgi:hypothetical protein
MERKRGEGKEEVWSGGERRVPGRPVYSRGPIILTLEIVSVMSGLIAIVALIITLTIFSSRVSQAEFNAKTAKEASVLIQEARFRAAEDTCFLLRGLVFAAATSHTAKEAEAYINSTSLRDCYQYGKKIENHP